MTGPLRYKLKQRPQKPPSPSISLFNSVPDKWTHANGDCGGKYQSPINVVTKKTVKDKRLTAFQFDNYQQIFTGTIKNNGHSGEHLSH